MRPSFVSRIRLISEVVRRAHLGCLLADRDFGLPLPHRLGILLVGPVQRPVQDSRAAQQPPPGAGQLGRTPRGTGRALSESRPPSGIDPHALRACPRRAASFGLRQWSCHPSPWVRAEFVLAAVPLACHIGRSTPVLSGQPRSLLLHRSAAVSSACSMNASRECA
jgi:hypothetical protein